MAVTASASGAEIFIEGLIDPNAEKLRLTKEIESKQKSADALRARLTNEAYNRQGPAGAGATDQRSTRGG